MSPQINIPEFPDNVFLINAEGCKIPKLDPYDPLIKAHLNIGTAKENTFVYIAVLFASKHRTRMNSSVTYILDTNCALSFTNV
jgi:hypothetical protein